jgi:hypothetical protein
MIKRFIILLLILISLNVSATTYYVATNGNDSRTTTQAQSISTPWATWKHGVEMLSAGDTLYIRAGRYTPANETTRSAYVYLDGMTSSRAAPLVISLYPPELAVGDSAVLDCRYQVASPQGYNNGLEFSNCNYVKFVGLTICNVRQDQRSIDLVNYGEYGHKTPGWTSSDCTNLIFDRCHSHHNGGAGFNIFNYNLSIVDTSMWINCDAYDNADSLSTYTLDLGVTWLRQAGNGADGFFLQQYDDFTTNYGLLEGCRAWGNADDGINLDQLCLTVMRNCWAFNNGDPTLSASEGNGFKIGDPPPHTPDYISRITHNNISANNMGFSYDPNNALGDEWTRAWTYNNISYNNKIGYLVQNCTESPLAASWCIYRNNISYLDSDYPWFNIPWAQDNMSWVFTLDHNTFQSYGSSPFWQDNPSFTVTADDFISLDVNELLASRKTDGSLPDVDFGKLDPTSDLIDGGVTDDNMSSLGIIYNGSAPDLGWYESGDSNIVLPIVNGSKLIIYQGIPVK